MKSELFDQWRKAHINHVDALLLLLKNCEFHDSFIIPMGNIEKFSFIPPDSSISATEQNQIREAVASSLIRYKHRITNSSDWFVLLANLAELSTDYKKCDLNKNAKQHFKGKIESFIGHVDYKWREFIQMTLNNCKDWMHPDNLILYSDDELKFKISDLLKDRSQLQKIKLLTHFASNLYRSSPSTMPRFLRVDLSAEFPIVSYSRGYLLEWIETNLMIIVPVIEFRSRSQIQLLKAEIEKLRERLNRSVSEVDYWTAPASSLSELKPVYCIDKRFDESLLSRRLNFLIESRCVVVPSDSDSHNDIKEAKQSSSASIIRSIVNILLLFNKDLNLSDMKIWISYLFLGFPGFSFDDIRKALDRSTPTHRYKCP